MDILAASYLWLKAFHVIAMVAWMAGLFYLPRLFVHHAERAAPGSEMSDTFVMMEAKLLRLIMNPAMIATWAAGLALSVTPGVVNWAGDGWFHVKLLAVVAMTGFHMWCARARRAFADDANRLSGRTYRMMNEVPTLLLVVIVVMVIVKPF